MQKRNKGQGLYQRNGIWHIDKEINGKRVCKSTRTSDRAEAERFLARLVEEDRAATVYGVRPQRNFRDAAIKFMEDFQDKKSIDRDAQDLSGLDPFIGDLPLDKIHDGTLQSYIKSRRTDGIKSATVNRALRVTSQILKLAAGKWRDENGLTWLATPPIISQVDWKDSRKPAPITWEEQELLFKDLPEHLFALCTFAVQTGCREQEICQLRWSWEVELPDTGAFGFILPDEIIKNGHDRLVVLNSTARAIVNRQRGKHKHFVFTYKGEQVKSMDNTSWRRIRKEAGLKHVRIHDLRHTFGRRLRAAGVPLETRKDLMGHKSGDITSHYSIAEVEELLTAAEKIAQKTKGGDGVSVISLRGLSPAKVPHTKIGGKIKRG